MPKTELLALMSVVLLNSLLWVPVVIGYVKARGPLKPEDYVRAPTGALPDWVDRANRAHTNAVENFSPFAATVLVAVALRFTTELTVALATTFAAARFLHAVVHISGFNKAMLRTVLFVIANTAAIVYGVLVLLQLLRGG